MTLNNLLVFLTLAGIYEPSAVQQLPDGRFLVVEDEKKHPFSLFTLNADGSVRSTPLNPGLFQGNDDFWKLDDLEGLAIDRAGFIYALTSHSRDGDGDEKKSRDKLVRFRIDGERVVDTTVVKGLNRADSGASRAGACRRDARRQEQRRTQHRSGWRSPPTSSTC